MPPNVRPAFPPNMPPPNTSKFTRQQTPNVFSAPPSLITKPSQQASNLTPMPSKPSMTFEAKPQIRYFFHASSSSMQYNLFSRARQDVTKFIPTVLKVKRGGTTTSSNVKGSDISGLQPTSRFEDPLSLRSRIGNTSSTPNQHHFMMTGPSTDDAYDTFMKEINQLV